MIARMATITLRRTVYVAAMLRPNDLAGVFDSMPARAYRPAAERLRT